MQHHYAIFSAQYLPHEGGVERYTQALTAELAGHGNSVDIVTLHNGADYIREEVDSSVRIHRLPGRLLMNGRLPIVRRNVAFARALDELARTDITRVLVNTRFYDLSVDGVRFAAENNIPAVVLDHGSAYLTLGNAVADKVLERYEHHMTNKVKQYQAKFAGVSRKSVEWLKTFDIETNAIVPNAIDASAFRSLASKRNFRMELGAERGRCLVAFTGRITPEKGVQQLAEAARLLPADEYTFALAGDGPLRKSLQAQAPHNVHFLGPVNRNDLSALLQAADLFCLPSRSEGFSTALLEAAACGLPIIATDVGGARELVLSEAYGEIIPDSQPATVAGALTRIANRLSEGSIGKTKILDQVEESSGWAHTIMCLDRAYQ